MELALASLGPPASFRLVSPRRRESGGPRHGRGARADPARGAGVSLVLVPRARHQLQLCLHRSRTSPRRLQLPRLRGRHASDVSDSNYGNSGQARPIRTARPTIAALHKPSHHPACASPLPRHRHRAHRAIRSFRRQPDHLAPQQCPVRQWVVERKAPQSAYGAARLRHLWRRGCRPSS
jgi:hypothetical protein